jgi:hypothetical protein
MTPEDYKGQVTLDYAIDTTNAYGDQAKPPEALPLPPTVVSSTPNNPVPDAQPVTRPRNAHETQATLLVPLPPGARLGHHLANIDRMSNAELLHGAGRLGAAAVHGIGHALGAPFAFIRDVHAGHTATSSARPNAPIAEVNPAIHTERQRLIDEGNAAQARRTAWIGRRIHGLGQIVTSPVRLAVGAWEAGQQAWGDITEGYHDTLAQAHVARAQFAGNLATKLATHSAEADAAAVKHRAKVTQ